jgi:hypothetical protein
LIETNLAYSLCRPCVYLRHGFFVLISPGKDGIEQAEVRDDDDEVSDCVNHVSLYLRLEKVLEGLIAIVFVEEKN